MDASALQRIAALLAVPCAADGAGVGTEVQGQSVDVFQTYHDRPEGSPYVVVSLIDDPERDGFALYWVEPRGAPDESYPIVAECGRCRMLACVCEALDGEGDDTPPPSGSPEAQSVHADTDARKGAQPA